MKAKDIQYTGMFIDDIHSLLEKFPPKHDKVFAHHVTNWYKPTSILDLNVGRKHNLEIIGQAYNSKCFALLVKNIKSKNEFPHITISCKPEIAPVYSNKLLKNSVKNKTLEIFNTPIIISATEGYVDNNNNLII